MANVKVMLARVTFDSTCVTATGWFDESEVDADGVPADDATYTGDIELQVVGPGFADLSVWRGNDHHDGKNPWREIVDVTEADGLIGFTPGGPIKDRGDTTSELKVRRA